VLVGDVDEIDLAWTESLLATEFEVIGVEQDGRLLVLTAVAKQPDVVVLPISMRSMSGIEAAREIRSAVPSVRIVFFTVHSERLLKREALRAGASAYVSKRAPEQLIGAIHAVLERDTVDKEIAGTGNGTAAGRINRVGLSCSLLTPRQRDVLQLVVQGCALKEIAAALDISSKTVEFHKYRLMARLQARSTAELIATALRHDLVSLKGPSGDGNRDSNHTSTRKAPHRDSYYHD
jgi:DNA-binding NarL/FixJ family response regulator